MTAIGRVALPALLFAALWVFVDVPSALGRLRDVDPRWIVAGVALVQFQVVLSALRWRFTAARLGHRIGAVRAIGEYYLATLLNQVLPGGVAGDAARAVRGRRGGGEGGEEVRLPTVARGVVVERLAGQLSLLLVTIGGLALWPLLLDAPPPRAGLLALATVLGVALAGAVLLFASARLGGARWRRAVDGLPVMLRRCWLDDGAWLVQGVLSVLVTASYLGVFAIAATATGAPLSIAAVATIVPLTLASMLLPVSIGGWGLREAAAAALWPLAGLSAEAGVAASVLYGLVSLAGSLPGLLPVLGPLARGRGGSPPED